MDRNVFIVLIFYTGHASLSARRAWIEMPTANQRILEYWVALRKESVDRNWQNIDERETISASLSARRAWIEIQIGDSKHIAFEVALRKESVDRNHQPIGTLSTADGRSPQGERG